jgi:hypothetical protein
MLDLEAATSVSTKENKNRGTMSSKKPIEAKPGRRKIYATTYKQQTLGWITLV